MANTASMDEVLRADKTAYRDSMSESMRSAEKYAAAMQGLALQTTSGFRKLAAQLAEDWLLLRKSLDSAIQDEQALKREKKLMSIVAAQKETAAALQELIPADRGAASKEPTAAAAADVKKDEEKKDEDKQPAFKTAIRKYVEDNEEAAGNITSTWEVAFREIDTRLNAFVLTGKLSFKGMADAIIKDLARIAVKKALVGLFGAILGPGVQREAIPVQKMPLDIQIGGIPIGGKSEGGYTGPGGRYEPAGLVHRGEGVLSQDDMAALGGPQGFNALRRRLRGGLGYSEGGVVAAVATPQLRGAGAQTTVEIINNGAPATAEARTETQPDGSQMIRIVLDAVADDMASGGRVAQAGKSRYNWQERV